ncbi:hypothetical protein STEG23_028035 [Scotinomys teguina]
MPPSSPLSAEQLLCIQRNKAVPLLNVPAGFRESWKQQLCREFRKWYFIKLMEFVAEERKHHKVYPPSDQVFTWTQMYDVRDIKVVILGQDPYHRPNQAASVSKDEFHLPSVWKTFLKSPDMEGFVHPSHGVLSGCARQGVLLLNALLTVRAYQANSHKKRGWEQFMDAVVSWLNQNLTGLVFLLWGSYAQKKSSCH